MDQHALADVKRQAPKAPSLCDRIEAFMRANPAEWLTVEDAMQKFGASRNSVTQTIYTLRQQGLKIKRRHVYCFEGDEG